MCLSLFDFTNFVSIKILLSEYEEFPAKILHSVKFFCFQSNINQTWSDCSTHDTAGLNVDLDLFFELAELMVEMS